MSRAAEPAASRRLTSTHWGTYEVEVAGGRVVALRPFDRDPDPSPIGAGLVDAVEAECRIPQPMVRVSYLERGPGAGGAGRGAEPFVAVSWDEALDLVAAELRRVRERHGNQAIYAGSYGWASAGRFHHAQSQLRRFMNLFGGHVFHKNSYSLAAAEVLLPHVIGEAMIALFARHTPWSVIAEHGGLVVAFGGIPAKNAQVNSGGVGRHALREGLRRCRDAGVRFVNLSPVRDDVEEWLEAEWHPLVPGSDTAVMLGLAHTLWTEGRHDAAFLERYCVGFERFRPYLTGERDGVPKTAEWAARLSGVPAERIRELARRMAGSRTLVAVSWSLQRADHGEQPFWMALTLAAMLGQIGLPGGGIGFGYGAVHGIGHDAPEIKWAALPQGQNPVRTFIPVARIADMLLDPGRTIDYDGSRLTLPDIRLVYWAGGNPFHHHQDLNRLLTAWRRPETIVVHEPWWTPLARHADIVLPATTALERNDLGAAALDGFLVAMRQAIPPVGEARSDFEAFAGLAARLGFADRFTEGRSEMQWVRALYETSRRGAAARGIELPEFDRFWQEGYAELAAPARPVVMLEDFRRDPAAHPLGTPSGRIEIFSETIDGFAYEDCPGHPVWREPREWLGSPLAARYPLHLISNQPRTRLHGQLDPGKTSRAAKIADREPIWIHPDDATARGIETGDVVRVFNDRGACLAGALVTRDVRPAVVQLATGAWYDPLEPGQVGTLDRHGNPNVLTRDAGCSRLSQGASAQSALVEVERYPGAPPPITVFQPPAVVRDRRDPGRGSRA
jgi:biotin/methionine sulfoxide reductase